MTLKIVDNRKKDVTTFGKLNVGDLFITSNGFFFLKVSDSDFQTNCVNFEKYHCGWMYDEDEVTLVSGKLVLE